MLPTTWRLARLSSATATPSPSDFIPATVPGAVQLDWAAAHNLPDYNYGENVRLWDGLEDSHWLYRTTVPTAPVPAGQRRVFVCGGVDYSCEVRLAGKKIHASTGLHVTFELDLTDAPAGADLDVLVFPAPKKAGVPANRLQATDVVKPAVSYSWDWHPRLVTLGLHTATGFAHRPAARLVSWDFDYILADDLSSADITVTAKTTENAPARWRLLDPAGKPVLEGLANSSTPTRLAHPTLWWTHDHGTPALYTLEVTLDAPGADTLRRRVGFRRVRLVMNEGTWDEPKTFPKGRSHPPITLELNGRRLFAKGSNWVNPSIFPGAVTRETHATLLGLARDAHFNLLRCWGGAPVQAESFFELCDELGLLVWQEFPLSCCPYPDTPEYLAALDAESRAIIHRVRQHPCLAMWVGGNELFNVWSGMTDQDFPLRLLNRNCYDLDRRTPFIPTAPIDGMSHGDYRFRDEHGRDIFQIFQTMRSTAYTEFGCPGPAPIESLRAYIPADELFPPKPGGTWQLHHAFGSWDIDPTTWLSTSTLEHYFGPATSLEQLVAQGEWLQSLGFTSVFEEARRQSPYCSMALNWCYNEAWFCAANNSIIAYPARPKAAYHAVKAACRPTLASARIPGFRWTSGDLFNAEVWVLHDAPAARPALTIHADLVVNGQRHRLLDWSAPAGPAQQNLAGPVARLPLPDVDAPTEFTLELHVEGRPELSSSYRLQLMPNLKPKTTSVRNTLNV